MGDEVLYLPNSKIIFLLPLSTFSIVLAFNKHNSSPLDIYKPSSLSTKELNDLVVEMVRQISRASNLKRRI